MPRRVLLIEDNVDIRESMSELLTDLGIEVTVAIDGPSGLAKLLKEPPDVALVDVGLPGLDGYEVARQARAGGCSVTLIALTGYSGPEAKAKAEQAGFNKHLVKPVRIDELTRLIQNSN